MYTKFVVPPVFFHPFPPLAFLNLFSLHRCFFYRLVTLRIWDCLFYRQVCFWWLRFYDVPPKLSISPAPSISLFFPHSSRPIFGPHSICNFELLKFLKAKKQPTRVVSPCEIQTFTTFIYNKRKKTTGCSIKYRKRSPWAYLMSILWSRR